MDFPVSIPWETLDPEILQKAINSGSNYRTYCDEKSWDISFEIEFLEKEEIIFLLLVEHGRRKGGTSVQKTNERTEISKYTKEEQAKMVNAFNQKLDTYEAWNSLFVGPTTSMFGNHVYESYMDYMYSWDHLDDRIFLSNYYERQLYSVQSDTHVTVKSNQEGYDSIYELAQAKVTDHTLEGICWNFFPKLLFSKGDLAGAPYHDVYHRLEILTDTEYLLVPALLSLKEKYEITAVAGNLDCPQMHSHTMTLKAAVQQAIFKNIFENLFPENGFLLQKAPKKMLLSAQKQAEEFSVASMNARKYPELLMQAAAKENFHCTAFQILQFSNNPYLSAFDKIDLFRRCMAISNQSEEPGIWKETYQNLLRVMICKITLEESQFSDPESIKELQDFTEHQQEKLEQEMQLKIPKEKTAEILLMNELKCMLACISVVTAEKIQGHKCTELAEKSWRLAESIEYIWNAEILNPQIRETVSKAFIRICIGCGSMYLQNVQEEHINPEQIQEAAEEISLLLYHYSDLLLPEEMPVYQIPIYQTLQIANIRLERKENALYYAQKGVVLCDLFSAGQNAQLNGLIQDSKNMFQQYINQNVPAASRPAKKKGLFSRLFQR